MILKIFLLRLLFVECRTIVRMDKLRQSAGFGLPEGVHGDVERRSLYIAFL